jgi:hypothetical protein
VLALAARTSAKLSVRSVPFVIGLVMLLTAGVGVAAAR